MTEAKMSEEQAANAAQAEKAVYEKKAEEQNSPNIPPPAAKSDGATSIAAESIPALIGGLHRRIDELEKAVHELTSHSIMRGIVPAESFLHRWYVRLRGAL